MFHRLGWPRVASVSEDIVNCIPDQFYQSPGESDKKPQWIKRKETRKITQKLSTKTKWCWKPIAHYIFSHGRFLEESATRTSRTVQRSFLRPITRVINSLVSFLQLLSLSAKHSQSHCISLIRICDLCSAIRMLKQPSQGLSWEGSVCTAHLGILLSHLWLRRAQCPKFSVRNSPLQFMRSHVMKPHHDEVVLTRLPIWFFGIIRPHHFENNFSWNQGNLILIRVSEQIWGNSSDKTDDLIDQLNRTFWRPIYSSGRTVCADAPVWIWKSGTQAKRWNDSKGSGLGKNTKVTMKADVFATAFKMPQNVIAWVSLLHSGDKAGEFRMDERSMQSLQKQKKLWPPWCHQLQMSPSVSFLFSLQE